MSITWEEITAYTYDDNDFAFTIVDADGVAVNIASYTFTLYMVNEDDSSDTLTITDYTITGAAAGQVTLSMTAAQAAGREDKRYKVRARGINPTSKKGTFADGLVLFLA